MRNLAGEAAFRKGGGYYKGGKVVLSLGAETEVSAKVRGNKTYNVKLWVEEGGLAFTCSCPVGLDGFLCKHCVAVGLMFLAHHDEGTGAKDVSSEPFIYLEVLRRFLEAQDKKYLIELLLEQAKLDERVAVRLMLLTTMSAGGKPDTSIFINMLSSVLSAVEHGEEVDFDDVILLVEGASVVVQGLMDMGFAHEALEFCEYLMMSMIQHADYFAHEGAFVVEEVLADIADMYVNACLGMNFPQAELAERLLQATLETGLMIFLLAVEQLGEKRGSALLKAGKQLARKEWDHLMRLGPGGLDRESALRLSRLEKHLEDLAQYSGDIDELIEIKEGNLTSPNDYLDVAELYMDAGRPDEALCLAEKGLKAFPDQNNALLKAFIADEYLVRGRYEEAIALVWSEFEKFMDIRVYKLLKAYADPAGLWPQWREKALSKMSSLFEERMEKGAQGRYKWYAETASSNLIEVYLWEKDFESAWQQALKGGCNVDLWMKMAKHRESEHPEDSVAVYKMLMNPTINRKNNKAYKEAVSQLKKIKKLLGGLGKGEEFRSYVASVVEKHKKKRNFIGLVNQAKLLF